MKMVCVAYGEALDKDVMGLLDQVGAGGYTKWTLVEGVGRTSGPHLRSHVWPKGNLVVMVVVEDEIAGLLVDAARRLKRDVSTEGLKAFVLNVEEQT